MKLNRQSTFANHRFILRSGKVFLILAVLLFSGFVANAQYDKKAKEILDKVAAKYEKMQGYDAAFVYRMHSPINEVDETQNGKIKVSGNKFRLMLNKQEIIVDGKTSWTIMKDGDDCEVNIMDYEPEEGEISPQNIYSMYKTGYKYVYNDELLIDGEKYHVIDMSPEDTENEFFKIRIQIKQSDLTISEWKIFEKSGNRYVYKITNFKEVTTFPAGTFRFDKTKYPGCEINDMK